jgi:hypothetical protein
MKRAVDIGPLDAAAIKTSGGKVRLRLMFTVEQIEALLEAARNGDGDDEEQADDVLRANLGRAQAPDPAKRVFVREGTPAWDSWVTYKRASSGNADWYLTTSHIEGGKTLTGWWFPSLFPPKNTTSPSHSITHRRRQSRSCEWALENQKTETRE